MYLPEGKIRMLEVQVFGIPSIGLLQSLPATGNSAALRAQQGAKTCSNVTYTSFDRESWSGQVHPVRTKQLFKLFA